MRKIVLASVLVATAVGFFAFRHHDAPDDRLALDRVWIDHLPKNDRDTVQVFAIVSDPEIGIFQAASQWKQMVELFKVRVAEGGKVAIVYPQSGERETVTATATQCSRDGFDYCLVLSGASRGVKEYGSRKGWEIEGKTDLAHMKLPAP